MNERLCKYHRPGSGVLFDLNNTYGVPTESSSDNGTYDVINESPQNGSNVNESVSMVLEIERVLLTRVVIAICSFGVIGNLLTLSLLIKRRWRHQKRRSISDNSVAKADILGLISLSLSDVLFCVSVLPHAATEFNKYTFDTPTFTLYFLLVDNAVINTFIMASTWLTVSMTLNRYAHLCHPILGLRYFGSRFMIGAIIISSVFSLVFNLPRFWFYVITYADCFDTKINEQFPVYGLSAGPMKSNKTAEAWYQWLYFVFGISLPLGTLAYCNGRIINAVYTSVAVEQRRNRERNLITKVLICIVIFYLLLVSPAEIIKFFANKITMSKTHIQTYNIAVTVLNTFQAVNFSCNFLPYLILDKKVRQFMSGLCVRKSRTVMTRNQYESVSMTTHYCDTTIQTRKPSLGSNNFVPMYKMRAEKDALP